MNKSESLFDSRIVERKIAQGLVSKEEYEAFIAELEDVADNAVECNTRFVRREQDEDQD